MNETREQAVIGAAQDFVATTTYWRQRKESRDEFECLAFALLALKAAASPGSAETPPEGEAQ